MPCGKGKNKMSDSAKRSGAVKVTIKPKNKQYRKGSKK